MVPLDIEEEGVVGDDDAINKIREPSFKDCSILIDGTKKCDGKNPFAL
jgi:hypothetical protein